MMIQETVTEIANRFQAIGAPKGCEADLSQAAQHLRFIYDKMNLYGQQEYEDPSPSFELEEIRKEGQCFVAVVNISTRLVTRRAAVIRYEPDAIV